MTWQLPAKLKTDIEFLVEGFGFKDEQEFVEEALQKHILALKKSNFLSEVEAVHRQLKKQNISDRDILEDFDVFHHQAGA